jgi:hypothetical protein
MCTIHDALVCKSYSTSQLITRKGNNGIAIIATKHFFKNNYVQKKTTVAPPCGSKLNPTSKGDIRRRLIVRLQNRLRDMIVPARSNDDGGTSSTRSINATSQAAHRSKVFEFLAAFLGRRNPKRLFLVVVEVAGVAGSCARWSERCIHLANEYTPQSACRRPQYAIHRDNVLADADNIYRSHVHQPFESLLNPEFLKSCSHASLEKSSGIRSSLKHHYMLRYIEALKPKYGQPVSNHKR